MQVETFELADLAKTRTTELCEDSDDCTRGQKVALAWVADMLQDGWEIWNPDEPSWLRMRMASLLHDKEYPSGVVVLDPDDGEIYQTHDNMLSALCAFANGEYYGEQGLDDMLEALEFGNTVPFRKWMRKI